MTKNEKNKLAEELLEVIRDHAEDNGLVLENGGIHFDEYGFRIVGITLVENHLYEKYKRNKFNQILSELKKKIWEWDGIEVFEYGKVFKHIDGDEYKLTGLNPKKKKPVLVENLRTGKKIDFGFETVRDTLIGKLNHLIQ